MTAPIKANAKAIVGGLSAFVGGLVTGAGDGHLTLVEWLIAVGAGLAALGGVYGVKNATAAPDGGN